MQIGDSNVTTKSQQGRSGRSRMTKSANHETLLDKSLQKLIFAFHLTGMNIANEERTFKQNCLYLFNFLWLNTDIVFTTHWIIDGILSGKSFTELTHVTPCFTLSALGDVKSIFIVLNERKLRDLTKNLRNLELRGDGVKDFVRDELAQPDIKFLNVVIKVLNVLNCLMIAVFDLTPLILIAVKYFTKGELELLLPFLDVYPINSLELRYWPFVYIHQIWSECIVLLDMCAADYFFFTCCTHIKIQFSLLQHELQHIIPDRKISAVETVDQKEIKTKLQDLVRWHQEIISTASMLESIYSNSNILNFFTSSFIICLTGFNVTVINDKALVMTFVTFLFMSMLQIFFFSLFGDTLIRSSTTVNDAIYNSRWYLSENKMGKDIIIIQTRAQQPCKVTAAGFADVNLRAFMKILSTAWSYFALLQTVYTSRAS